MIKEELAGNLVKGGVAVGGWATLVEAGVLSLTLLNWLIYAVAIIVIQVILIPLAKWGADKFKAWCSKKFGKDEAVEKIVDNTVDAVEDLAEDLVEKIKDESEKSE